MSMLMASTSESHSYSGCNCLSDTADCCYPSVRVVCVTCYSTTDDVCRGVVGKCGGGRILAMSIDGSVEDSCLTDSSVSD